MKKYFLILFVFTGSALFAQNDAVILDNLIADDSSSVPVLFGYPDTIRTAIFNASTYPQGFVRLSEIQKNSADAFKKAVSGFDQDKQKEFWEVERYPELVPLLIKNKDVNAGTWNELLKNYPEKTRIAAIDVATHAQSTLTEMEKIHSDFENKYSEVIKGFPNEVRNSFGILLKDPEIVGILSNEMKTTVTLGDIYKRDPGLIKHKADSLSVELAKQKALEYEDWKNGLKNDTAASRDLKNVSQEFAKEENGEDDSYSSTQYNVYVNYGYNPYPYWCGYPYWYAQPYWYPYPWWYQCGYYWLPDGNIVFIGMPNYYFGYWYFYHPYHHYYHPHLSHHFYHHYEGHHNSHYGFDRSVHSWEKQNHSTLSSSWLKDDAGRPDRFKEFGKLEMDVQQYNKNNPTKPVTTAEYLGKNQISYPTLQPSVVKQPQLITAPKNNETTFPENNPKEHPKQPYEQPDQPKNFPQQNPQPKYNPPVNKPQPSPQPKPQPSPQPRNIPQPKQNPITPPRKK